MAHLNILPSQNEITIQTDSNDWTSLTINGKSYPALNANIPIQGEDITFEAVYSPGSPGTINDFPMVLQDPSDSGQIWFADVTTSADGSSCKISGTVKSYKNAQVGGSGEGFNANGLTASFNMN
ncbi:MAG: hypothetical protein RIC35_19255 [Marinoscillum sp.]